jgi:integron integrase
MGKLHYNKGGDILPDFQKFLLEKKLAPEKDVFFYAFWANQFFNYARKKQLASDIYHENAIAEFLETLKSDPNVSDWQIRQANDAVGLYYFHYCGLKPDHGSSKESANLLPDIFEETKRLIRLKHYSYSTERTYLQWIKRFFDYCAQAGGKATSNDIDASDFKDFISHLALRQKVSSSTQNQAFNALLFLFRNVFCKETGDLGGTVRAKRGLRLHVVLSVEEVKTLLARMSGKNCLMAELLYGSGLRLMELASLRVKDIDFDSDTVTVRSGKGDKDRTTILPLAIKERLIEHLKTVKDLHDKDIAAGRGEVYLPDALSRKYPDSGKLWAWQYVFPSATLSVDPRSGRIGRRHISDKSI